MTKIKTENQSGKAIPEQMICADEGKVWATPSGKVLCPVCRSILIPDSDYPNDLLCGRCEKAFDANMMEEIPWNP